ncbi:monocarboxylate transporter 12 [Apis florea]|uniref:monocarboxylate transporter 12 n=1 Tax=Apis florea TaxID=7463 RepID=UPI0012FEE727|nr:monocarboxylate transporter 12 [Apis florea]
MAYTIVSSSIEANRQNKKNVNKENIVCMDSSNIIKPPDGGWGYIVVLAAFLIHVIVDGTTYSFGVFYLEFLYYFEEGKGATAWIASILVGVTLSSGPISGWFVNKFGCRIVAIAGSVIASMCLVMSMWARNIMTLYFSIGIGTGLGFGCIYLPAIVSVTCYFEKYRSLATGIAVCGSGLGTLIFAPFLDYLVSIYGWRGTFLICAGIILNCIVLGALFRPLEMNKEKKKNFKENKLCSVSFRKENKTDIKSLSQPVLISNNIIQDNSENIYKQYPNLTQEHSEEVLHIHEFSKSLSNKMEHIKSDYKCDSFKNPIFILFIFSNFCTSIGFYIPYIYILPQAEEQGINKQNASYLLAVIGIANIIGRIIMGYISDKQCVNRLLIYILVLLICGVSSISSV